MSSPRRQMCRRRHFLRTIGASPFPLLLRLRSGTWRIQGLWPMYRRRLVGRCGSPSQEIADGLPVLTTTARCAGTTRNRIGPRKSVCRHCPGAKSGLLPDDGHNRPRASPLISLQNENKTLVSRGITCCPDLLSCRRAPSVRRPPLSSGS